MWASCLPRWWRGSLRCSSWGRAAELTALPLRSNNRSKSEVDACCARRPHACASRLRTTSPQPALPPPWRALLTGWARSLTIWSTKFLIKSRSVALYISVCSYTNFNIFAVVSFWVFVCPNNIFSGVVGGPWGWLGCGVARRAGLGAGARSARQHLISSRVSERSVSAVSSATCPKAEHRSAVGASRPPR